LLVNELRGRPPGAARPLWFSDCALARRSRAGERAPEPAHRGPAPTAWDLDAGAFP